jgi:hypothetical protein
VEFEAPSKVRSFGHLAFSYCNSLVSISIPPSVESMARQCFAACPNLADVRVEFGSQLHPMQVSPFACCPSLKAIRVPRGLKALQKGLLPADDLVKVVAYEPDDRRAGKRQT